MVTSTNNTDHEAMISHGSQKYLQLIIREAMVGVGLRTYLAISTRFDLVVGCLDGGCVAPGLNKLII